MAYKITIKGKVHEVGYRLFLLEEADSLFIPCFDARNVKINGKEALIVLVDGEKEQLEQFIEFLKRNKPENALVEEISVEEFKGRVRDIEKFRASFNTSQLSKIVQVGIKMLEKQDLMLTKMDTMLEKQDLMLQKQDTMLGKMDLMLQKQDETIKEIKETRVELKKEIKEVKEEVKVISSKLDKTNDLLEKRFERLEQEIERIKKALIKAGI
ncbi:MAG: acylphosphatase, partial [Archaeoglobaceae archaeon]